MDEIKILWDTLETTKGPSPAMRYGIRILLRSGVRSGELRQAKWSEIDLENKLWTIPVANQKLTKGQAQKASAFRVPLSDMAVEQFLLLKEYSPTEWVLPGKPAKDGKSMPLSDKAMARAVARMFQQDLIPIQKFHPHDLRRSLRSGLSRLRISPVVAEKCLNHSLGRIAATYDVHDFLEERREALDKWADAVNLAVNPRENVSQIRSA